MVRPCSPHRPSRARRHRLDLSGVEARARAEPGPPYGAHSAGYPRSASRTCAGTVSSSRSTCQAFTRTSPSLRQSTCAARTASATGAACARTIPFHVKQQCLLSEEEQRRAAPLNARKPMGFSLFGALGERRAQGPSRRRQVRPSWHGFGGPKHESPKHDIAKA